MWAVPHDGRHHVSSPQKAVAPAESSNPGLSPRSCLHLPYVTLSFSACLPACPHAFLLRSSHIPSASHLRSLFLRSSQS